MTTDEAMQHANYYTTTLHAINSSIVKLGKLTIANPVYCGIADMGLPKEFWVANAFNVRGGIEAAFRSTTTDKEVARAYSIGSSGRSTLFEMPQGMINRGADIGCRCPNEKSYQRDLK